jgi:hypothetical protein
MTQQQPSYSFSGDVLQNRSTFRPQASIQSYQATLNHLIDILSKREILYRIYFSQKFNSHFLPTNLAATPFNPLVNELKAGFLYKDPINISTEARRNLTTNLTNHSKTLYFQEFYNFYTKLGLTKLNLFNLFKVNFLLKEGEN